MLAACLEAVVFHKVWGHFDAAAVKRALFNETEDPRWLVEARIGGIAKGLLLAPGDSVPGLSVRLPWAFRLGSRGRKVV
jgi:hypothetical protein